MGTANKELILVLPNTFFHNSFRAFDGYEQGDMDKLKYCRFVANLIIELSSVLPENKYIAATSSKAFGEFATKLESDKEEFFLASEDLIGLFERMIYIISEESINKLSDEESMIAIADRLYSASNYEPIIIVNGESRHNFLKAAQTYYRLSGNVELVADNIPFKLYDPHEAKAFLEGRYSVECKKVIERTRTELRV